MIRGMYVSASGMDTQLRKQDVISNNLANADTPGFKKESLVVDSFAQMLISRVNDSNDQGAAQVIGAISLGSDPLGTVTDFSEGKMIPTQRELDFAIQGKGFFAVDTPQGVRYTRQGSFTVSRQGQLVTTEGYPVAGENGPLQIGPDSRFNSRGELTEGGAVVNRMLVVEAAPRDMIKQGESLYSLSQEGQAVPAGDYGLAQGYLESSNVNPVSEMVNMISGMRAYEANQKALVSQDDSLGRLIADGLRT